MKVSKDIPLAEITLRKYEKPYDLDKRELVKKLCLSIGLLQPGDSRDVVIDVFLTLINSKELLDSKQIEENVINIRKSYNLELKGIAPSNIRRQIKRLRDIFLVENINNKYRISENDSLINIFEEKIEKFYIKSIMDRVKEYFKTINQ